MALLRGTSAGEFLNGTNDADVMLGLDGNDTINGNNGADVILGGGGIDTVSGGNGGDMISGGSGNDSLNGNNGDDVLSGDEGADNLVGGNGADVMSGGSGNDIFTIDKSDTFITGDDGSDTAILDGTGAFDLRGNLIGTETILQGSGNTTVSLDGDLFASVEGTKVNIDLDGGNDTVNIYYNGSVLDFDKGSGESSEVIFGPTGGTLNKSIDFDNVEHLNFINTATGASGNHDWWLT
jgi:hypothetical protein